MPPRPLPVLPGAYYGIVEATAGGLPSNNLFSFQLVPAPASGASDVTAAGVVAAAMAAHWPAFASAVFPTDYAATFAKVYPLNTPINPAVLHAMVAPGGLVGPLAPLMVGIALSHNVLRRGKGSQTRSTFSPLTVNEIDATGLKTTVSQQAAVQTAFATWLTAVETDIVAGMPGTTVTHVVVSKGTPTHAPATYQILNSAVELLLTTQRRRVRRNG